MGSILLRPGGPQLQLPALSEASEAASASASSALGGSSERDSRSGRPRVGPGMFEIEVAEPS